MLVVRAALLFVLGSALGYAINAVRADGVPLSGFEPPHACGAVAEPAATVLVLSAADAASAIDGGGVLLLDARAADAYEQGHVDGAMHLPCASASHEAERALARARSEEAVLVYGDDLDDARPMAEELARRIGGSRRVSLVDGGYHALVEAGAAAESGSCERCTSPRSSQ